jgi:hypothetical protein
MCRFDEADRRHSGAPPQLPWMRLVTWQVPRGWGHPNCGFQIFAHRRGVRLTLSLYRLGTNSRRTSTSNWVPVKKSLFFEIQVTVLCPRHPPWAISGGLAEQALLVDNSSSFLGLTDTLSQNYCSNKRGMKMNDDSDDVRRSSLGQPARSRVLRFQQGSFHPLTPSWLV